MCAEDSYKDKVQSTRISAQEQAEVVNRFMELRQEKMRSDNTGEREKLKQSHRAKHLARLLIFHNPAGRDKGRMPRCLGIYRSRCIHCQKASSFFVRMTRMLAFPLSASKTCESASIRCSQKRAKVLAKRF